ncbi:MAG: hypothetical protein DHS20C21_04890 [Gemmatimonadota bacterium]|nr:MAG: hypothetical protein DHS20C21_04890 [Gemmatimonadota bacterium]
MVNVIRGAIVLVAMGAFLAACGGGGGSQQKVVAKAGDIVVTMGDFQDAYNKISPKSRPDISTLEGKRSFANDLINQRILLLEGERIGGAEEPVIVDFVKDARQKKVLELLYRDEVETKVDVLGSDVKDFYDHRSETVRASHILLDSMEEAARVRAEIESGKISFEDAAFKYSMDQGTRKKGGDLGEIRWARTVPEFQAAAFSLEPGVLSEPLETSFGVHIIKTVERVPAELGDFETVRLQLRPEVRRDMEAARMREFIEGIQERANLQFHDDAIETVLSSMSQFENVDVDTVPAPERYIPVLTPEQQGQELATWDGGSWRISDYIGWLRGQPPTQRPFTRIPRNGMRELIRSTQLQTPMLMRAAEELGYNDRDEVRESEQRTVESLLIEMVHGRFIQQADVPQEDVAALYDSTLAADPEAFAVPERIEMMIIVQNDEDIVRKALARLARGEDEAAIIEEVSLDPRTKAQGGRSGLIARGTFAPQIEDVAFDATLVGKGWQGPVFATNGVAALKVLEHQPSRQATLEEVGPEITRQLALARGEAAFEAWLQEQRDARGVEIFDEVLELHGQSIS